MAASILALAKELILALVQTGKVSAEDMQETLQKTHAILTALKAQEESDVSTAAPASRTAPVDWRKSITQHAVTCLECGQSFKQLPSRHLGMHGLDSRSYRTKYGIPPTQPLSARATTARRRQIVQEIRPWEKVPTYRKGQARNGTASPEPEAETVHEAAEEPSATSPAQPKRQRKTTPKKQTIRKKQAAE
jgi:predicted transcriptional regulator